MGMGGLQAVQTRESVEAVDRDQVESWVERARAGDTVAFERLYRAHAGRIHALVWRLCGNDAALAEDLVQEAFIRAWNNSGCFSR